MRKILAGTAAALALTTVAPAAQASTGWACSIDVICVVASLPCQTFPKYFTCPL